jgi:crotonobetainyl-CoA:carnitine CoA-transferase CaiB-like acyl-CoA transferase
MVIFSMATAFKWTRSWRIPRAALPSRCVFSAIDSRRTAARIPASALLSPQDALDDAHVKAMHFMKEVDFPGTPRPAPLIEMPFRMSETPGSIRTRAPLLGEHTEEVLTELGYNGAEIADLRTRAVV